ncbi:MAG: hypothetical protein ABI972_01985 [Acidobacteriota bacterium]
MSRLILLLIAAAALCAIALGQLDGSYTLPLEDPVIDYAKAPVTERVYQLKLEIESGKRKLAYDPDLGYLPSLLKALDVPVSSQTLVFSKTSFQAPRISPRTPRALYFNDSVSVGMVRGGDVLELAAHDAQQGTIFYTLDQEPGGSPLIMRRDDCLQCHLSGRTAGIPGVMVRSVYPDSTGMPLFQAGGFVNDHRSPLKERWGGWYVTGTHGAQVHMGNSVSRSRQDADFDFTAGSNLLKLDRFIDTGAYLSPHSDIVALMVMEHQVRAQNLLTRVNWEVRMALRQQAAMNEMLKKPADQLSESTERRIRNLTEYLVEYLLMKDEVQLTEPVKGTSGFTEEFSARGPHDAQGRGLRQLDLKRRLFRYPLSYMIYSEAFDQLPALVKARAFTRLGEILSGRDQTASYSNLSVEDRQAILEILRATLKGLPEGFGG